MLDLRDWDFEKDGEVPLSGKWKFRWNSNAENYRLPEYDDSGWNTFEVPGIWDEKTGSAKGYGWLQLKVQLPPGKDLGIYLTSAFTSHTMYLNGKEFIQNGICRVCKKQCDAIRITGTNKRGGAYC